MGPFEGKTADLEAWLGGGRWPGVAAVAAGWQSTLGTCPGVPSPFPLLVGTLDPIFWGPLCAEGCTRSPQIMFLSRSAARLASRPRPPWCCDAVVLGRAEGSSVLPWGGRGGAGGGSRRLSSPRGPGLFPLPGRDRPFPTSGARRREGIWAAREERRGERGEGWPAAGRGRAGGHRPSGSCPQSPPPQMQAWPAARRRRSG